MRDGLESTTIDVTTTGITPPPVDGSKPRYECEECGEAFSVKRELATHQRIHSGEQPHTCTQCGKEFGTRQLLKKHWMWHTGQRSHVCPHCSKAFFQKGHLTQHLMIHSGGRPHECQQCHKTFIFKFDLNRHMKIHQERGYSCQQCGRSFLKSMMLEEHHLKCKGKPSSPKVNLMRMTKPASNNTVSTTTPTLLNSIPMVCVLCQARFTNQNEFAIHTYMHHIANQVQLTIDSNPTNNLGLLSSLSETSSNPSSSPQKASPLPLLESASMTIEHSSISPSSSSSSSSSSLIHSSTSPCGADSSASASSTSATSQNCKECAASWQRIQELESQMAAKADEFANHRNMMKMVVSTVSNLLSQSSTDNIFVTHATNIFKQLQNTL